MKRIKDPLKLAISGFSILILLTLTINVVMQVVFRYILQISVPWTEEAARLAIIWMVFFGLILVQADKEQIRTDYFINKLPVTLRVGLEKVINVCSILLLFVVFKGALGMLKHTSGVQMGAMPWLSSSVLYIPVLLALPLTVLYLIKDICSQPTEGPGRE